MHIAWDDLSEVLTKMTENKKLWILKAHRNETVVLLV